MSETVIILGAGASKAAGAPLMGEFFDRANDLLAAGKVTPQSRAAFEAVAQARKKLEGANARGSLDIDNLESVFAAFEMLNLFGETGQFSAEEASSLSLDIRRVIEETLVLSIEFPVDRYGNPRAPAPYESLGMALLPQKLEPASRSLTFMTFNYDLCLDLMFHVLQWPVDYRLDDRQVNGVRLLKLHGSMNWGLCPTCRKVYPLRLTDYLGTVGLRLYNDRFLLPVPEQLRSRTHCEGGDQTEVFLVPPTWNKGGYHQRIQSVWRAAARELETAENILVAGYSLPESDYFFKYLFALGTFGGSSLRRIWVHDPNEEVKRHYEEMLGTVAKKRFEFRENAPTFDKAIADWSKELGWSRTTRA